MKELVGFIRSYVRTLNWPLFTANTLFISVLVSWNYYTGLDSTIGLFDAAWQRFLLRYLLFLASFLIPYLFHAIRTRDKLFKDPLFVFLILVAPAIFSLKMATNHRFQFSTGAAWNEYYNQVVYWPIRVVFISIVLFSIWKTFYPREDFFGLTGRGFKWKPYLILLVLMIPLLLLASTQEDFRMVYPKLQQVSAVFNGSWTDVPLALLYELSYGSDFFSIELFFRGFLVLAFIRFAGKDAILPMACFYCAIHFGKPLGECISSYFGGLLLGIIVYRTRSIYGGLVVHLGIAWIMELVSI